MMDLSQTKLVGLTMELELKAREYEKLCNKLEQLKKKMKKFIRQGETKCRGRRHFPTLPSAKAAPVLHSHPCATVCRRRLRYFLPRTSTTFFVPR